MTDYPPFSLTRIIEAGRDRVWDAWTRPEHLEKWWGPVGLGLEVVSFDFRPGGIFHYAMVMPTGQRGYGRFVYEDITPPGEIKYLNSFADEKGDVTRAPFSPSWPLEVENILTLTELPGNRTALLLSAFPLEATDLEIQTFLGMYPSMTQGFTGTLNQLDTFLKTNS